MENKIYSFLGLAAKAGKLISGEDACERTLKSKRIPLLIVAENASENTKKKFADMCKYRNIELRYFGEKELLGRYTGKEIRVVIAVNDRGFAKRLKELLDGYQVQNGGEIIGKG